MSKSSQEKKALVSAEDDREVFNQPGVVPPPRRHVDRRQNERRYLTIPIRFLTTNGNECAGVLKDISVCGLRVECDSIVPVGDELILYIDKLGRFEGSVVRHTDSGFAINMLLSEGKRARMEQAINDYFNREAPDADTSDRRADVVDRRSSPRRAVSTGEIFGETADGKRFKLRVLDLSLGGAEIETEASLDVGDEVTIGKTAAVVTRKTQNGVALKRL